MQLARNPVYHSKHRRRYHFTRRLVEDSVVFREDRGVQGIQQTFCVDVGTLRLCETSIGMVQIENEILG